MPSPRIPPSPREAPSTVHSRSSPSCARGARSGRRARGRATSEQPVDAVSIVTPGQPGRVLARPARAASSTVLPAPCARGMRRGCRCSEPARRLPAQPRGQPAAEQQRGGAPSPGGGGPSRALSSPQRRAPLGRVERRGDALAPRRRAQPGEVDDVGVAQRARARARAPPRASGSSTESIRTTCDQPQQRVDRLVVPVRRPHHVGRSVTTSGSTIVSRPGRCARPDVDHDPLAHHARARPAPARPSARDRRTGVERRAARLDRAHDRARRVVAPDALAAGWRSRRCHSRSTTHDQVEHARRRRSAAFSAWRSREQLAQRRLDRRRASCPARSRRVGRRAHQIARQRCAVAAAARRPPRALRAGRVLRQRRRRPSLPRARGSGRRCATAPRPRRCG